LGPKFLAAVGQHPAGQRRRRRFAVRAGDHDRACAPEKVLADGLGQRAVSNFSIEDLFELGVAARDRVADDDEIEVRRDVLGAIAREGRDAFGGEEVAHRRVDILIRSAHVEALALQHRGKRRHRRAADADQVNLGHRLAPLPQRTRPPPRPTRLFELRRGLAGAPRAKADKDTVAHRSFNEGGRTPLTRPPPPR
jgi:hypothetical protein